MGTRKDPKLKKTSLRRSARHRITTKPADTTKASRLAPQNYLRKPTIIVRRTKSPLFPPSTATTAPFGTAKRWRAWETDLIISLRKAGKTYSEISQQVPGRSMAACKYKIFDISKLQKQGLGPHQKDDDKLTNDDKWWQPWEEELLISSFKIGKSYGDVSQQLPGRSEEACRIRLQRLLKPRMQDPIENPVSARLWEDWEDQLIITNYDAGKGWAEIYKLLPSRTKHSILGRWQTQLKARVQGYTCSKWSQEEDQLLVDLHTAGEGWAEIAKRIPNRSMDACTGRWKRLVHYHPDISKAGRRSRKWTKLEKGNLVSLVNAVGPRYYEIAKNLPGRTEIACKNFYIRRCAKETEMSGPSREYWLNSWDNPETEMDSSETNLAAQVGEVEMDLDVGEFTSAPVIVAPTLKGNQHSKSFNAKKKQAIHVPMI